MNGKERKDDVNFFMRFRVDLPISKPLRREGFIAGSNEESSWVSFKYERLPIFYHYCGILGHDLKHCATHYTVQKNGGNLEYQYGDFLRPTGGRARASTSQYTSNKSNSEEVEGNGPMKLSDLMVHSLRKTVTVREQDLGNPREEDKDDAMIFME